MPGALRLPLVYFALSRPQEDLIKKSGIGKALFSFLKDPRETASNKQVLQGIVVAWTRLSVPRAAVDYASVRDRTLSTEEAQEILQRKKVRNESRANSPIPWA